MRKTFAIAVFLFVCFYAVRADNALQELNARRNELYKQYLQRLDENKARGNKVFTLHLQDALTHGGNHRAALSLKLSIQDGAVSLLRAWSPRYNRAEHENVAANLSLKNGLAGKIKLILRSDGYIPVNDESVLLELSVDVPLNKPDATAIYELELPNGPGETPLIELAGLIQVEDLSPQIHPLPPLPESLSAAQIEAYRQCRALALALVHNSALETLLPGSTVSTESNRTAVAENEDVVILAYDPDDPALADRMLNAAESDLIPVTAGPQRPDDHLFGPWTEIRPLSSGSALTAGEWFHPVDWRQLAGMPVPPASNNDVKKQSALFISSGDKLLIGDIFVPWADVKSTENGLVTAPKGLFSQLAYTAITLDEPGRIWVALTPWLHELGRDTYKARARLWLNDELVWSSDDYDRQQAEALVILPFDLRQGTHRLAVQAWQRPASPANFRLAVRLGGKPLEGPALSARNQAMQQQLIAEQERVTANIRGDRINWRGKVPDTHPPLAWDEARGINIAWRTALPDWTVAAPVVHKGRVFTVGNPHNLHCLNADDGTLLWSRAFDVRELLTEEQRTALNSAETEAQKAWNKLQENMEIADDEKNRLNRIVQNYHTLANRFGIDCLKFTDTAWRSFRQGHYMPYGAASSAPVTDGQYVWVRSIEGAVACFDFLGNRRWMIHLPVLDHDGIPSPLLIDGMLIVEGFHEPPLLDRNKLKRKKWIVGINAANGEILWRTQIANPRQMQGVGVTSLAPPIPVAVSDGKQARTVIVTVTGTVVDPQSGRVLAEINLGTGGTRQNQGYPVAEGNRIVFAGQAKHSAMVELLPVGNEIGVRRLWHSVCRHNNYGALLHDGKVWQHSWWFGARPWKGHISFMELVALDQKSGRIVNLMEHVHRDIAETTTFPQLLLTHGDVLWAGSTATAPDSNYHGQKGTLTALRLEEHPYVLARNLVETYFSNPAAENDRFYLRTKTGMLCIGYTGETGHKYEQQVLADTILANIPPRPVFTDPKEIIPFKFNAFPQAPVWTPRSGPRSWYYITVDRPVTEILPALGGAIEKLPQIKKNWSSPPPEAWAERGAERALDLLKINGIKDGKMLFVSLSKIERRGVFSFDLRGGKMFKAWLAGQPIEHGSLLRLSPGVYPLLVEVKLQQALPFVNMFLLPQLIPAKDPEREAQRWRQIVQQNSPGLREIAAFDDQENRQVRLARELLDVANSSK